MNVRALSLRVVTLIVSGVLAVGCSEPIASIETATSQPAFAVASSGRVGFGFNGVVSGFPTGVVRLTGGGSYAPATASNTLGVETTATSSGGFDCVEPVGQSKLSGCGKGEGVRWDTEQLLASTSFKCTGAQAEAFKPIATSATTAVLQADFYRAGDGNDESFKAQIIISDTDIAPDIPGTQTLWVQGVGCGDANVHFSR